MNDVKFNVPTKILVKFSDRNNEILENVIEVEVDYIPEKITSFYFLTEKGNNITCMFGVEAIEVVAD